MTHGRTNVYINTDRSDKFHDALAYCKKTHQSASRIMTDALIGWYEQQERVGAK